MLRVRHTILKMTTIPSAGPPATPRVTGKRRRSGGPSWLAALSGVLAAATTLGAAQLVAVLVSPAAAPLVAVGGVFIDAMPLRLKNFAVATFGTSDKFVLLICKGPVIAAVAAVAGVRARRRWALGAAVVIVLVSCAVNSL
jgi:hypothetical protein